MIDPLDPAVRAWLQRELPRLVSDGQITVAQADLIARRYGVTVTAADIAAATALAAPSEAPATNAAPPSPAGTADTDPVIGMIGAEAATAANGDAGASSAGAGQWVASTAPAPSAGSPSGSQAGVPPGSPFAPPAAAGQPAPTAARSTPFVADHAVSIVLYLGAFLVVAAVIIFLSYSWEDMSGGARLTVLAVLTGGFLAAAAVCLPRPSVRPAGRTFLALGAILVPANVAAVYLVYFWDSPIPPAVFWLLGALISGSLHAFLSVRLHSYGYAVLAMPSIPVAASALGWLIVPDWPWIGVFSAAALVLALVAARRAPPLPLVQTARVIGSGLLVLAFLVTLPALSERGIGQHSTPIALLLMSGGLAWEATRRGHTWWFGALAALGTAPMIAFALGVEDERYWFVSAVILTCWLTALVASRLAGNQRLLWACAALLPAALYPPAAWGDDRASLLFFASLIALAGFMSWAHRSPLPLYLGVLAVDGAYIKLLDIYGSPDSPPWSLGVALWPLGIIWVGLGTFAPRRLSGPAWLAALVTMLLAAIITWQEPRWSLAVTSSAAVATIIAAWRLRLAIIVPLAGIWLIAAGYQGAALLDLPTVWRFVVVALTGWLLFAVSVVHPAGLLTTRPRPAAAPPAPPSEPTESAAASTQPAQSVDDTNTPGAPAVASAHAPVAGGASGPGRPPFGAASLPTLGASTIGEWVLLSRLGALVVAGVALLLLFGSLPNATAARDTWLVASTVAWLNVVVLLATWALLSRSWLLALFSALAVVPALLCGILRLHLDDAQYLALPVGVYLLAVAMVARRRRQPAIASIIAGVGLVVVVGTSVLQSFDRDGVRYALLALVEGLLLVGIGIAVRWRVVVACGVAGTVLIVLRQLFAVVSELPWWAILGGSGILLLGSAVALLLIRARLTAAGRAVADRWSQWD